MSSSPANEDNNNTSLFKSSTMASFALPVLTVALLSPISLEQLIPLGFWGDIAQDIVYYMFGGVALALLSILMTLFTGVIATFLFPPAPSQIGGLGQLFMQSAFAFFVIVSVSGLSYFGYMMIFPHNEKADPFRYFNRLFAAFIFLAAGRPLLNNAFIAVNELGRFIYPNTFNIAFAADGIMGLVSQMGGAILAILVSIVLLKLTAIGTILGFLAILSIRALLIYAVYALFPVFLGLWVVDVGPLKYGNMVAELAFKAFALLLAFGILISAILATGAAIAGWQGNEVNTDQPDDVDGMIEQTGGGSSAGDCSGTNVDGYNCQRNGVLIKLMAFFGSLWAALALGASSLGMLISMRGSGSSVAQGSSGGGGGGGSGMQMQSNPNESTQAGPESTSGKISQAKQDIGDSDRVAGKGTTAAAHGVSGAKSAVDSVDSITDTIAQSGNSSVMDGMKSAKGKMEGAYQNRGSKPDSAVEDVQQNADSLQGNQADMAGVEYDGDNETLTDGENSIDYDGGDDGPDLEDGQRYDMENLDIDQDDDGNVTASANEDTTATERNPGSDWGEEKGNAAINKGKSAVDSAQQKTSNAFDKAHNFVGGNDNDNN